MNKTDIEIMTYAMRHEIFTAYEVSTFLNQMNVQQLRRTLQKLTDFSILEVIRSGTKNKPALYMLTYKGEQVLDEYSEMWNSHSEGLDIEGKSTSTDK